MRHKVCGFSMNNWISGQTQQRFCFSLPALLRWLDHLLLMMWIQDPNWNIPLCRLYNHIQLSSNLLSGCDYSLFKVNAFKFPQLATSVYFVYSVNIFSSSGVFSECQFVLFFLKNKIELKLKLHGSMVAVFKICWRCLYVGLNGL